MNAATRNQAAALLGHLLDAGRPTRTHTLTRARRILEAAKRRPHNQLPIRIHRAACRQALAELEFEDFTLPPSEWSQAEYCAGCLIRREGFCNVILKRGEECADRVTAEEHDFAIASGDFNEPMSPADLCGDCARFNSAANVCLKTGNPEPVTPGCPDFKPAWPPYDEAGQ